MFREIGHVYWTNGLLGGMAPYPFADDPPKLVGKAAMGSLNTWANNGMFGMGFMQAGFVGMLLYGVVYGIWLYVIDCISIGRVPVEVAVSMVIVPDNACRHGRRFADEPFDPWRHRRDADAMAVGGIMAEGAEYGGDEAVGTRIEMELSDGAQGHFVGQKLRRWRLPRGARLRQVGHGEGDE